MLRSALLVLAPALLVAPSQSPPVSGGLAMDQVVGVVKAHSNSLGACWDAEYKRKPQPKGDVVMSWQIDPTGAVSTTSVLSATSPNLSDCIGKEVRTWRFPKADTATTVTGFPFHFAES